MIRTRDDLMYALALAAEVEHNLCCQYLFSAYGLKKFAREGLTPDQERMIGEWRSTLAEIARQEMEHLGFVNNLLTAVGGAPHFWRPNLPQPAGIYGTGVPMSLEPLSPASLRRYVQFEKPCDVPPEPPGDPGVADPAPVAVPWNDLEELYARIRDAFETFPQDELFIGPASAQVDSADIGLEDNVRVYGLELFHVTGRDAAVRAIDRIIEEGEGATADRGSISPDSHYARLVAMSEALDAELERDPSFDPARPVVSNPMTRGSRLRGSGKGTLITDPFTWRVAELSNAAYETLLLTLIRFYAHTDERADELAALRDLAFFPLMVMAVRPLAEILTELPVGPEHPGLTAGPPFEFYREVTFLPHREAAWIVLREKLEEMAAACEALCRDDRAPERVAERLAFVHENLGRMAMNFRHAIESRS